jgi:hypothetical protein
MAHAHDSRRCSDGAASAPLDRAHYGGGSHDCAFRQRTLLALDDCLYALQAGIPHLNRSGLHRCLQRHGISRLPEIEGDKPAKKKFAKYAIGYFHLDIAEVHIEQGRLYLFVAIDRTSKFAYAETAT